MSDEQIAIEMTHWLQQLSTRNNLLGHFEVRLYGGWYDEDDLSRHGSDAARVVSNMPEFPMRLNDGRILRGDVSLAVSPLASGGKNPLMGTYRRRGSLPRIRLTQQPYPDSCAQVDASCPAAILKSFTRHANRNCPVDTCSLVARDAFVVHEQKMVDTLLATDIITAGRAKSDFALIVVVSGDSDFVPPLLAAQLINDVKLVQLLPRADEASNYATETLSNAGIEILEVAA